MAVLDVRGGRLTVFLGGFGAGQFLGIFCTMLDCIHGTQRGKVYLKTLLAAFGGVWILSVSVLSIICNFLFFLMLAMRLDGDLSVKISMITVPLILHYCFSAMLGPARYYVGQRELSADESVAAMVDVRSHEEQQVCHGIPHSCCFASRTRLSTTEQG
jgi:hypothetical protein